MAIVINGSGTVTGLAVGGLPDGTVDAGTLATDSVTAAKIAADSVDSAELIDGAVDNSHLADNAVGLAEMASGTDGNIISYDASGNPAAIATGNDGQVLTSTGAGSPPAFEDAAAGGITESDMWRLTTSFQGNAAPLTSNLERVDSDGFGLLGTGMSQSSGVFTFPSTGYWYITAQANFYGGSSSNHVNFEIQSTTDNSSYSLASRAYDSISHVTGNTHAHTHVDFLFKVTSTSTHKIRFSVNVAVASVYCEGDTNDNLTSMSFIKLGDV